MMFNCECENICHMAEHTDDCNYNHSYGKEFPIAKQVSVKTDFGTFKVCSDCYENHLKEWEIN